MTITCDVYVNGLRQLERRTLAEAVPTVAAEGGFIWVDLERPSAGDLAEITAQLGLPDAVMQDSMRSHARPDLQDHDDLAVIVLKAIRYLSQEQIAESSEIYVLLGSTFVITVRQDDGFEITEVRAQLDRHPDDVKVLGPGSVLSDLSMVIVDGYESALSRINSDIDTLETAVFSPGDSDHSESIYRLKRQIADFRRAAVPLAQGLEELMDSEVVVLAAVPEHYLRDILRRAQRSADSVEAIDRLLNDILQVNAARVSAGQSKTALRQNEDTRKISAWAAIALVPTMVTGIYGMNFQYMPELQWPVGYPAVIVAILVFCVVLHRLFVRNGWL